MTTESSDSSPDPARRAGDRAVRNTMVRAAGELAGKVASLLVFALLAREVGPAELADYVFGLAWAEMVMPPIGLGIDRYLLRKIAADRSALEDNFWNAQAMKFVRGALLLALTVAAALLLDFGEQRRLALCLLTAGVFAETISHTHVSVFNAFERGELVATLVLVQRLTAAALGLAALAAGYGVVAVAGAFLAGALLRLALAYWLLGRYIGMPAPSLPRETRIDLRRRSLPFSTQDLFGLVVARADVLLLSLLSTSTAVGLYGAAYRLFEATSFLVVALAGAFNAMYTYLGPDTTPSIRSIFERSLKLGLLALLPIGTAFGLLAEPLCVAFFGEGLREAGGSLQLLAPVVVLAGLLTLSSGLIISRRPPMVFIRIVAGAAVANLVLNLILIPPLGAEGAALAMLLSELVYVAPALVIATRTVGGVDWRRILTAPTAAAMAMAGSLLLISTPLGVALAAGSVVFVLAYVALERMISPADLEFAAGAVGRILRGRAASA